MKITSVITRIILGLLFTVFGLNGFLNFLPMGPMPTGPAGQFVGAMIESHYMAVVFGLQLISGILLLVNWYVPLALTVLAPIIVNIVMFHAFMAPGGLPLAIVASILWLSTAYRYRSIFSGLLQKRVEISLDPAGKVPAPQTS